jgi:hypothetical protein
MLSCEFDILESKEAFDKFDSMKKHVIQPSFSVDLYDSPFHYFVFCFVKGEISRS